MAAGAREWQDRSRAAELADAFAHRHGLDLYEALLSEVPDDTAAGRQLELARQLLPEVPSAYRPSGAVPLRALLVLTFGAAVGVPAGLAAGALAAFLGVEAATSRPHRGGGKRGFLMPLMGLALCALAVPAAGFLAGLTTTGFNRWAKNRSRAVAALFALLAALPAMLLTWVLFAAYGQSQLEEQFRYPPGGLTGIGIAVAAVGAVAGAALAGYTAAERVGQEKFCEDCQRYMSKTLLPALDLGPMRALARALGEHDLPAALSLLKLAAGGMGEPELYACPNCGKGYVEMQVRYKATWPGDDKKRKEKTKSWLAASLPLEANETELFRPYKAGPSEAAKP